MKEFQTIYEGGEAEIVEKKSRFIALHTYHVTTEEEVQVSAFAKVRKEYWDARHNCWAYVLGKDQVSARCSDGGERSQSSRKAYAGCDYGTGPP